MTYAPQNPYIGEDRFRIIQRIGHPLQAGAVFLHSGHHQRTLSGLPACRLLIRQRIGFYGLSYGGKDGRPRAAAARWLCSLDLLRRLQRVGLEDDQCPFVATVTC